MKCLKKLKNTSPMHKSEDYDFNMYHNMLLLNTTYCGTYYSKKEYRQKITQKDNGITVNIYYIFTKARPYLVFSRKSYRKLTQYIVFFLLTKSAVSVIIFYGRFGTDVRTAKQTK